MIVPGLSFRFEMRRSMNAIRQKVLGAAIGFAITLALTGVGTTQPRDGSLHQSQSQTVLLPTPTPTPTPAQSSNKEINVSWLYGAFVPKDVPLKSLDNHERTQLWIRSSFTTWGIYLKTAFFAGLDQVQNTPPDWGPHWAGFGKRFLSHQGQFVIQNSLSALGDGILRYEPRYDRCRCNGFWPRAGHAVVRNFVTYDRTETKVRLAIPLYVAAFGAGVVQGTWTPNHDLLTTGAHGVLTEAGFGIVANFIGEFWPEIERIWKH
jgi:hypothetical protein